ncbi:MAG: hypothetical protein P4L76_08490 [Beijerinckiaceae bacterium]|nr:hypothetical protein [Beijerinckiaceae bacterium]
MHYGLLEKVAKGEVRVSQLAVDILAPESEAQRKQALLDAALSPELFKSLKERFPESRFSESALRSYLVRLGFLERAVDPVIKAYTETCRYLEQENVSESGGIATKADQESTHHEYGADREIPKSTSKAPSVEKRETEAMADERVLTTGLLSKGANFRLIVNGRIGVKEIEMLIKKLEIDKEILADDGDAETPKEDNIFK